MNTLNGYVAFSSGSPQFRIVESLVPDAPRYIYYSQSDLEDDLVGMRSSNNGNKEVRTKDRVHTLAAGDVLFSLIAGKAAIVGDGHAGYIYTQNYIKLMPTSAIEPGFLVYLLNEDRFIRRQFFVGLQGSQVLKYNLKQLKELRVGSLPALARQRQIGSIYFKQLHLKALKNQAAEWELELCLGRLAEASKE